LTFPLARKKISALGDHMLWIALVALIMVIFGLGPYRERLFHKLRGVDKDADWRARQFAKKFRK